MMMMMKRGVVIAALSSLLSSTGVDAFAPVSQIRTTAAAAVARSSSSSSLLFLSSTPEEDEKKQVERTTFDQAGASIMDEDNEERLRQMGDFDSNPESKSANVDKMREAIRARTADLGLEKSKVSQDYFQEMSARASSQQQNTGAAPSAPAPAPEEDATQLDLSQISTQPMLGAKGNRANRGEWDEELPTMLFNPEDEMTDEEKKEVDKVGQLPIWEQALAELKEAKWPTPGAAFREVGLMIVVVCFTGALIIGWDSLLRDFYTTLGMIPNADDIKSSFQDINFLPDGWTNGMSEEDIAGLQEVIGKGASNAASSASSSSIGKDISIGPDIGMPDSNSFLPDL